MQRVKLFLFLLIFRCLIWAPLLSGDVHVSVTYFVTASIGLNSAVLSIEHLGNHVYILLQTRNGVARVFVRLYMHNYICKTAGIYQRSLNACIIHKPLSCVWKIMVVL